MQNISANPHCPTGVCFELQADVSQTLCCLAIPADMSVAHFCTFIGAYLGEVRSIQVWVLRNGVVVLQCHPPVHLPLQASRAWVVYDTHM